MVDSAFIIWDDHVLYCILIVFSLQNLFFKVDFFPFPIIFSTKHKVLLVSLTTKKNGLSVSVRLSVFVSLMLTSRVYVFICCCQFFLFFVFLMWQYNNMSFFSFWLVCKCLYLKIKAKKVFFGNPQNSSSRFTSPPSLLNLTSFIYLLFLLFATEGEKSIELKSN